MTSPIRLVASTLGVALLCVAPAAAHPIVPGFERFHSGQDGSPSVGGWLLLNELNCVSCHAVDAGAKKQAPVLDELGARARIGHIRKFLADPHTVKPGTTMPALFAGDPDKDAKVEAIVHFLAGTGTPRQVRPDLKAIIRGRDTYAKIGCAACHGGRDLAGDPMRPQFAFAVPLGDLRAKYTIPGLAAFLADPLRSRPSGRMPHLLKPNEANDIAHFMLQGLKANLVAGQGTTKYAYFEGGWEKLPDFSKMKPKVAGTTVAFEIGVSKQESNYGLRFEGFFGAAAAGAYTFHLASDDGSRLLIDGKKVVDNDGIHPTQSKSATVELTKGVHQITVDFFQGGGEHVLEVEIESRHLIRQPLGPLVAATEADLDRKVEPKTAAKDEDALTVDPALASKGRELFATTGCANCHQLAGADKKPIESAGKPASPLRDLKTLDGCLNVKGVKGLPKYDLSAAQLRSIGSAIAKLPPAPKSPSEVIARTMLTFNCYACHTRD
jgi:mono/diheme cytochrome c family protein